jgi:hypothetical protein
MKIKPYMFALMLPATALSLHAQSGGPFELRWSTVDGGGGTSSNQQFTVTGTIGQLDAGRLAGGSFALEGGFWGGVSLLQTPRAPHLKIKFIVDRLAVISWPMSAMGFVLEESSAAGDGVWNATPQSIVDTATEHTVSVSAAGIFKYYRLKK